MAPVGYKRGSGLRRHRQSMVLSYLPCSRMRVKNQFPRVTIRPNWGTHDALWTPRRGSGENLITSELCCFWCAPEESVHRCVTKQMLLSMEKLDGSHQPQEVYLCSFQGSAARQTHGQTDSTQDTTGRQPDTRDRHTGMHRTHN